MTSLEKHDIDVKIPGQDYPFSYHFEDSVPVQEGPYVVFANSLNSDGKVTGGGIVACFKKFPEANNCFEDIMDANPAYKPEIQRVDWAHDNYVTVRTIENTVYEARKNAQAALAREQDHYEEAA